MWQQKDAASLVRLKPFQRPSAGLPAQVKRQEYVKALRPYTMARG